MIIIPGIIARHHYWHIAHCNASQWTHQKPRGKPCPWSEPSFDGVMTHDTDTMSHEEHINNANYNITPFQGDGQTGCLSTVWCSSTFNTENRRDILTFGMSCCQLLFLIHLSSYSSYLLTPSSYVKSLTRKYSNINFRS